mmetsp:Transcript_24473/g.37181  ORF Transcript_24473/g.37181 Transcript_24473/m.37181 type:complete len:88 (+) Transcript_24473:867-1130(+)
MVDRQEAKADMRLDLVATAAPILRNHGLHRDLTWRPEEAILTVGGVTEVEAAAEATAAADARQPSESGRPPANWGAAVFPEQKRPIV